MRKYLFNYCNEDFIVAGVDVNAMAGQTQQLSSGSMFIATIIQVIVLGAIAMGFLALSILILKKLPRETEKPDLSDVILS